MKRTTLCLVLAATVAGASAVALAGPGCKKSGCSKSKVRAISMAELTAQSVDPLAIDSGVAEVMKMLPKMSYKVGDVETCCSNTAASLSEKSGTPVQYVVAGETFACREMAMNKLADEIQAELPKVARVVHVVDGESMGCPKSAAKLASEKNCDVKHMVAGVEFGCDKTAAAVADRLAAKLAESKGCAKSFAATAGLKAETASANSGGCCSKKTPAAAKTASAKEGGCCAKKTAAEAKMASAKEGGCCAKKAAAAAKTASAKEGGCCAKKAAAEAKTATVKSGGCCSKKADAAAKTASATSGCPHAAKAAAIASAKGGCEQAGCAKSGGCANKCGKSTTATEAKTADAAPVVDENIEDTPKLANAKLLVREIVEYVAASQKS